jgi:hypothetical protein
MFSSKGLTAQQLQLIEQLLKESRSGKIVSMPASQTFTAMPSTSFSLPTTLANSSSVSTVVSTPRLSPTVVKKASLTTCAVTTGVGDKPVECTICNRKFKNIPALNGHMRLHGGYYKKDSDGKRIPPTSNLKQNNLKLNKIGMVTTKNGAKRKCPTLNHQDLVPEKKSSLCPINVQSSLSSLQPVTSAMFSIISANQRSPLSPNLHLNTPHFEASQPVVCPPAPQPSLAFQSLPPPDTNKLLENLEKKNFGMISMKADTFEGFKDKLKPVPHLSKGIGVKDSSPKIGNFITTFGLPPISLPTKPIPQLQLEETSLASQPQPKSLPAVIVKPEIILPSEAPAPKEESLEIKEEISFQDLNGSITFPSCFPVAVDSTATTAVMSSSVGTGNLFGATTSSSGLNQFLNSSALPCQTRNHQHQMLKVDKESDKTPKVGEAFQAELPDCKASDEKSTRADDSLDLLLWNPDTLLDDVSIDDYLMLASSCAVHLGSHNEELALELLQKYDGKLTDAVQELLASPNNDDDDGDKSQASDGDSETSEPEEEEESSSHGGSKANPWTELEVNAFYEGLVKHKKDFAKISQLIKTRSVEDCVDFYYIWKNFCRDESTSFKSIFFSQCSKVSQDPSGRELPSNNNNNNNSLQGHDPESTSLQ